MHAFHHTRVICSYGTNSQNWLIPRFRLSHGVIYGRSFGSNGTVWSPEWQMNTKRSAIKTTGTKAKLTTRCAQVAPVQVPCMKKPSLELHPEFDVLCMRNHFCNRIDQVGRRSTWCKRALLAEANANMMDAKTAWAVQLQRALT